MFETVSTLGQAPTDIDTLDHLPGLHRQQLRRTDKASPVNADVNGRGGSLERYLGTDALARWHLYAWVMSTQCWANVKARWKVEQRPSSAHSSARSETPAAGSHGRI